MELLTETKSGEPVRLVVDRDKYGVHQVYAFPGATDDGIVSRCLCNGWAIIKTGEGFAGGIFAQGRFIEVDKKDWEKISAVRDELRDRENLADIHLVRVYAHGDKMTVDGYTLSAKVDRETWSRIASFMEFADSSVNDVLHSGDRFIGYVIKRGREEEVEAILGVKPENSIRWRSAEDGGLSRD